MIRSYETKSTKRVLKMLLLVPRCETILYYTIRCSRSVSYFSVCDGYSLRFTVVTTTEYYSILYNVWTCCNYYHILLSYS